MKTWKTLSLRDQEAIQHAAKEAAAYSRKLVSERQNQMLNDMEKAGATIYHPDLQAWHDSQTPAVLKFHVGCASGFKVLEMISIRSKALGSM